MTWVDEVRKRVGEPGRGQYEEPPTWPGNPPTQRGNPPTQPGNPPTQPGNPPTQQTASTRRSGRPPRPPIKVSPRREAVSKARMVGRTIVKIDTRTVFVVSLLFYLCGVVVVLVAGIVLWIVASLAGGIHSVNHFIQQLFGYKSFSLIGIRVLLVTVLCGIVLSLIGTVVNVVIASVFNLVSDIVGGVRIAVVEERSERRPFS